jgi:hypothetical protein
MIRSFDLALAKNARGDSGLLTAALFAAAGKYFGNDAYTATAERIARCLFDRKHIQIEEGENAGLFKWFAGAPGMGAESVYVSDSSRVGNAVLALYRLGGREEYKRRAVMLGEALLSRFGGEPLLPTCYLNYSKSTVKSVQGGSRRCAAEFYDAPLLFLKNLYAVTGDERYRAQVIRTATVLAERYPNYDALASHSDNFTYGRLLGALAAVGLTGIVFFPAYAYPLLWISPLTVFVLVQFLLGEKSVLDSFAVGNWSVFFRFAVASLICGFCWETWNYHAYAKWIYAVPYVHRFQIWEMPLIGFAGYLPFGVECAAVTAWISPLLVYTGGARGEGKQ